MIVPCSVRDFLDRAAPVYPDQVGVIDEPHQPAQSPGGLTYAPVEEMARSMAAALDALDVPRGARVAIVSQNSARLLVSFFGVSGYGRVLVPVNFRLSAKEVSHIIEESGATVLLIDPELEHRLSGVAAKHRFILGSDTDTSLFRVGQDPTDRDPDENATATINYTSGTTARPKGVQLTHRTMWVNATTFALHAEISDRDVYLHTLPMFHVNGWGMPFAFAGFGAPQVILRAVDGTGILRRVEEQGVTVMCAAPAVVDSVLEAAHSWQGRSPAVTECA